MRKVLIWLCAGSAVALTGCSNAQQLTDRPISVDAYVDSTFSNDQVARECLPDIMTAAKLAAASRGSFSLHTFDGDPFRRRGLSESFREEVPLDVQGTSGELEHLEDQADALQAEIEELIEEPPVVGGTPLLDLLRRAERKSPSSRAVRRLLICTDGLFTDLTPKDVTVAEARRASEQIGDNLDGVTVDLIGLDASDPGRGRHIEAIRPRVEAVLEGAGMELGSWDVELGAEWRDEMIAEADGSDG